MAEHNEQAIELPTEQPGGLRVLGVSGSLHEKSRSATVLELVLRLATARGAQTRLLDLRVIELPLYRPSRQASEAEQRMLEDILWAEAVVLASPDYHGSISGALKNFLDYTGDECAGKLFGYICSSHEKGLTVMDQMRTVVRQCYGWSMPYGVSFHGHTDLDAAGVVVNTRIEARLKMMARDLVSYGTLLHRQFASDLASDEPSTFAAAYRE
jgi:FMN reductase